MTTKEFADYVRSLVSSAPIFEGNQPTEEDALTCIALYRKGGETDYGGLRGLSEPAFKALVRSESYGDAERIAYELHRALHNTSDLRIGDAHVRWIIAEGEPSHIGNFSGHPQFSVHFAVGLHAA